MMAELNMNYLHLHATDDEGWRIEIPDFPELTSGSDFNFGNIRIFNTQG